MTLNTCQTRASPLVLYKNIAASNTTSSWFTNQWSIPLSRKKRSNNLLHFKILFLEKDIRAHAMFFYVMWCDHKDTILRNACNNFLNSYSLQSGVDRKATAASWPLLTFYCKLYLHPLVCLVPFSKNFGNRILSFRNLEVLNEICL